MWLPRIEAEFRDDVVFARVAGLARHFPANLENSPDMNGTASGRHEIVSGFA
jgi:hypothetical protein